MEFQREIKYLKHVNKKNLKKDNDFVTILKEQKCNCVSRTNKPMENPI